MTEPYDNDTGNASSADAGATDLDWSMLVVPSERLTDRELIARAEYCAEIARTGRSADRAGALAGLDAVRDQAENRAAGQPADSTPAQVAGYLGLVCEDDDRALAAEAATWRRQLDAALPPAVLAPASRVHEEVPLQREAAESKLDERAVQEMLVNETPLRRAFIRASFTDDIAAVPAQSGGRERADLGETVLTVEQRADRAQSLAQGAGVDVAGYDPDTDVYTDPDTGQIVRLDGRPADGPPARWAADRHKAYLDSRPAETNYNPAAEYGDGDWREPASDYEAAARTAWLEQHTAPATGWVMHPPTEVEDALDAAGEQAVLSDRAHDHDPVAWAEYQRLLALSDLAPLPDQPDALDRRQTEEAEEAAIEDGRYVDYEGRSWPSVDAWVTARADPAKAADTSHPDDLPRLRQRLAALQAQPGAEADGELEAEQRREQLTRWHHDDHGNTDTATTADAAGSNETDAGGAGEGAVTRRPPQQGGDGEFARVEALAGLAREVDGLRRHLEALVAVPERVDDLARTVAQLADAVSAMPARPGPTVAPSWLTAPSESEATRQLLAELTDWLHAVFLRYPDGVAVLPECWLWHPDAVEEILWLMHAWRAAYQGRGASVQLAGDWHDRQRPGVVRRLRTAVGSCSRERHQTRAGWNTTPQGAVPVPGADAAHLIAWWWAGARDQPAPEPEPTSQPDPQQPGPRLRDALDGHSGPSNGTRW